MEFLSDEVAILSEELVSPSKTGLTESGIVLEVDIFGEEVETDVD